MAGKQAFQATPIDVPSMDEIAELYQHALSVKDDHLKSAAQQAVARLAAAEAAAAEAATFVGFANKVRK
jgi:hypothetical protein